MSIVEVAVADHIATVTLNRPDARNAMNPEMIVALDEIWERIAADDAIRVAIITCSGGSTFCSGFDLRTTIPLMTGTRDPENEFEKAVSDDLGLLGRATLRDLDIAKPVVAAVNGHAVAGGFELMLGADLRVVGSGVRLGLSEVALGLIPAMGGTARLARLMPPALASELLLTAQPMPSEAALAAGLVNRVVAIDEVYQTARDLAATIASNAPLAVRAARDVIRASGDLTEREALALEAERSAALATTEDAIEGPTAFVEKRTPIFRGR